MVEGDASVGGGGVDSGHDKVSMPPWGRLGWRYTYTSARNPVFFKQSWNNLFFAQMPLESTITTICPNSRLVWCKRSTEPNNHLGIETSKPVWNLDGKTGCV